MWWMDNDGSRQALVKGYSRSWKNAALVDDIILGMSLNFMYSWFARVPTECNMGDMPSRLEWEKLKALVPGVVIRAIEDSTWERV